MPSGVIATESGRSPTVMVADSVDRGADHRDGVTATVENVDAATVGGDCHPVRGPSDGDGCDNAERHDLPSGRACDLAHRG